MELDTKFCTTIDRPPLFFWLEADEMGIFMTFIVLSFVFYHRAGPGALAGAVATWAYIKFFKKKGGVRKLMHIFWRLGLFDYPLLPPGYARYFWE
jgi:hypothetical protein